MADLAAVILKVDSSGAFSKKRMARQPLTNQATITSSLKTCLSGCNLEVSILKRHISGFLLGRCACLHLKLTSSFWLVT